MCVKGGVEVVWQVSTHQSLLKKERTRKKSYINGKRPLNINPHFTDWLSLRWPQTSESLWPWNQIIASSAWERHMFGRGDNTEGFLESVGDTGKWREQTKNRQKKQRCKGVRWINIIFSLFYRHSSYKKKVPSSQHYSDIFCQITSHRVTM